MAFESKLHENNDSATAIVPAESEAVSSCSPVFAKVNLQTSKDVSSGISIKLANAELTIAPDTPAEHVRMVLEALAYAQ